MTREADRVQQQMQALQDEEAMILQELRAMDGKIATSGKANRQISPRRNWRNVLNHLLQACEREVRDAKGYVVSEGPPLKIARVERGSRAPAHATYLSRPRNTGVDFTVPVRSAEYNAIVKNPVWLNLIRDRCRRGEYASSEDFLDDMRLMARNTALYNKGPEVQWVVEHARLLLEVAEDAVLKRKDDFFEAEEGLRIKEASKRSGVISGKRKRGSDGGAVIGSGGAGTVKVGSMLDILWEPNGRWYSAKVVGMRGLRAVQVVYFDDNTSESLDLGKSKWRFTSEGRSRDGYVGRRKGTRVASTPGDVVTRHDLEELRTELLHKIDDLQSALVNEIRYIFRRMGDTLLEPEKANHVENTVSEVLDETKKAHQNVVKEIQELHDLITDDRLPKRRKSADKDGDQRKYSEEIGDVDDFTAGVEKHGKRASEEVHMDDHFDDDEMDVDARRRFEVAADLGLDSDTEEIDCSARNADAQPNGRRDVSDGTEEESAGEDGGRKAAAMKKEFDKENGYKAHAEKSKKRGSVIQERSGKEFGKEKADGGEEEVLEEEELLGGGVAREERRSMDNGPEVIVVGENGEPDKDDDEEVM